VLAGQRSRHSRLLNGKPVTSVCRSASKSTVVCQDGHMLGARTQHTSVTNQMHKNYQSRYIYQSLVCARSPFQEAPGTASEAVMMSHLHFVTAQHLKTARSSEHNTRMLHDTTLTIKPISTKPMQHSRFLMHQKRSWCCQPAGLHMHQLAPTSPPSTTLSHATTVLVWFNKQVAAAEPLPGCSLNCRHCWHPCCCCCCRCCRQSHPRCHGAGHCRNRRPSPCSA
jgi:hypothetical protein